MRPREPEKLWNYVRLLQKLSHYLQQPPENQTQIYHFVYITFEKRKLINQADVVCLSYFVTISVISIGMVLNLEKWSNNV